MFFYYATGITPAMSEAKPGTGSAYAATFRDAPGSYLDRGRTYKVTLPAPSPRRPSGYSRPTTIRPVRSSRPAKGQRESSTARCQASTGMKRTGCTPCPVGATASFCGSTGPWSRGLSRAGSRAPANCRPERAAATRCARREASGWSPSRERKSSRPVQVRLLVKRSPPKQCWPPRDQDQRTVTATRACAVSVHAEGPAGHP
jgi:hypothetical protein